MLDIHIDADGCAVKDEVYKVADRYQLQVFVVANKYLTTPPIARVKMIIAPHDFDGADDWIVAHAGAPETAVPTGRNGGLHGSRMSDGGNPAPRQPQRYVLPAGTLG